MKKRWKLNPVDRELQEALMRDLDILPLTAQLLINRGLVDTDRALSFLSPELTDLHDPFLLKDMDKAVARIMEAIDKEEKIAIYGDYDVDGITSTAILHLFFKELGVETLCYIPERLKEGYGLNTGAIDKLHENGIRLVITCDCAIADHDEVAHAGRLGMDCIITDHHEPTGEIPKACAVIDPKQQDCAFPFKGLAGVGVAFNLLMGLRARLREAGKFPDAAPNLKKYLDIVCIGTVADMVPLVDENRVFTSYGLKELLNTARPGLRALMNVCGVGKKSTLGTYEIAYQLAPRINAAGRMDKASIALDLIITDDPGEGSRLADRLNSENSSRQRIEAAILEEALEKVGPAPAGRALVVYKQGWHPGVIGIVASRLAMRFARPAVMIAVEDGVGKGSLRGIKGFDVLEGLRACADLLERYGGHKAAAGLEIKEDNIEAFVAAFVAHADAALSDEDLVPEVECDAVVTLDEIDDGLIKDIQRLSPFGQSNREPLLCATGASILSSEVVGKKHLRLKISQNGSSRQAIAFGRAEMHPLRGDGFDIAFFPYLDEWNGVVRLRLRVDEIKRSGPEA